MRTAAGGSADLHARKQTAWARQACNRGDCEFKVLAPGSPIRLVRHVWQRRRALVSEQRFQTSPLANRDRVRSPTTASTGSASMRTITAGPRTPGPQARRSGRETGKPGRPTTPMRPHAATSTPRQTQTIRGCRPSTRARAQAVVARTSPSWTARRPAVRTPARRARASARPGRPRPGTPLASTPRTQSSRTAPAGRSLGLLPAERRLPPAAGRRPPAYASRE